MPLRITINWQTRHITYWWPWGVVVCPVREWESLYDVLCCALANKYRREDFTDRATILTCDPFAL